MAPVKPRRPTARTTISRSTSDPRGRYAPPTAPDTDTTPDTGTTADDSSHDNTANRKKSTLGETPSADGTFSLLFPDTFKTNKRDKRTIKHNTLLHKVHAAGIAKKEKARQKRRRPAKKLHTDVGDLADALPDVEENGDEWEGIEEDGEGMEVEGVRKKRRRRKVDGDGKMVMKSLKSRSGAMKRKSAMEERERERFRRNLAQMMAGTDRKEEGPSAQAERWKALRGFIGSTMEKDKAFAGA